MDEKILELLQEMQGSIKGIQGEIKGINTRLDGMENDIKDLKTGQVKTNNRFDSIDKHFDIVESQLNENTQILKALEHKANVSKAEHDKMSFDILNIQGDMTETKENIQEVTNKLNTLETVTIDNWKDITKLKRIK
ncbi:TPA: hypothetical protein KM834_002803 [Clostridioides difficile]|nr:hypothetical protein [Clostridioides difficile]HBE8991897.1 hypothetical protein [Clostridioides difficile]